MCWCNLVSDEATWEAGHATGEASKWFTNASVHHLNSSMGVDLETSKKYAGLLSSISKFIRKSYISYEGAPNTTEGGIARVELRPGQT